MNRETNRKTNTKTDTKKLIITIVVIILAVRLAFSLLVTRPLKRAQDRYLDNAREVTEELYNLSNIADPEKTLQKEVEGYIEYSKNFDPFDYLTVSFRGENGRGYVHYERECDPMDLIMISAIESDKREGLSNGDKINVTVRYPDFTKKDQVSTRSRRFVVSGLK